MADNVKVLTRVKVSATAKVTGIAPKGVIEITKNGTYDIANYKKVEIAVIEDAITVESLLNSNY